MSHQNDASANIAGRDYAQDYGYWRYAGETVLEWKPSSRHRVRLGAERVIKDYEETPGLVSVDWTQWMASASYRVRLIGGQSASASYATGYRDYKDEPAAESSGRELPTNPAERHRYRELALKYSIPLTRRADLEVGYSRDSKEDLFQGYESRRSEGFHAEVGVEALPGVELRLAGARSWRDYQHILADAGRPLSYRLQEASVGSRVHVLAPTWVFFQLSYFERDTNKSTGTLYRDHTGTVTRTGVNVFF
ncbi:MAG: hypothetical protein R3E12_02930 [Candidatus Eisenbacteria bacterium]